MSFISTDTIVARATPAGPSSIGVIRLSGPRAAAIASSLFKGTSNQPLDTAPSHTLQHGWIMEPAGPVDEVLAVVMRAPRSYTGEDVVEISAHGGALVLSRILELCCASGARMAEPGEFTFRAFMHGKLDLVKAEAVADLISSKTAVSARSAARQMRGALSHKLHLFRQQLVALLANLEAGLDHTDDDIRFLTTEQAAADITLLRESLSALAKTSTRGKLLREGISIPLIGKPNAGKSSLLNALLERERAIVTDIPGTTRDIIEETLDMNGLPVIVSDTAGLREHTYDPVEKIGQQRALEAMLNAGLILWIVEAPAALTADDRYIANLLLQHQCAEKTIIIKNKADLGISLSDQVLREILPGSVACIALSSTQGAGLESLEQAVASFAGSAGLAADEPLVTNARHAQALERAAAALAAAATAVQANETEEITAFHLREALDALGDITGETTPEDILDTIFSRFCVGK